VTPVSLSVTSLLAFPEDSTVSLTPGGEHSLQLVAVNMQTVAIQVRSPPAVTRACVC
jgi:hypothetical protein